MAGVKHTFSVAIPDDSSASAAGMVLPSHWNAEHALSGVAATTDVDAVSAALVALSAQHTSLAGAVATNSAQMGSADNAISAAVAALSAQHTSLAASVAGALSAIAANSADVTSAKGRLDGVSANLTSVAGRLDTESAARAALSVQLTSLAGSVAGALSAIAANSAQMTSADNAVSAAVAAVSANVTSVAGRLDGVSANVTSIGGRVDTNSAAYTSLVSNVASISVALAGILTSSQGPAKRILAGDQIVSATAPVSISGFTFTCSAGAGYEFAFGIFTSAALSLAGNKFVLSAPSSSPIIAIYNQGGMVGGVSVLNVERTNVTMANVSVSATGVPIACYVRGTFRCSANGGTMNLAIGNNVSGGAIGSSITVLAGSYGYCWKMA